MRCWSSCFLLLASQSSACMLQQEESYYLGGAPGTGGSGAGASATCGDETCVADPLPVYLLPEAELDLLQSAGKSVDIEAPASPPAKCHVAWHDHQLFVRCVVSEATDWYLLLQLQATETVSSLMVRRQSEEYAQTCDGFECPRPFDLSAPNPMGFEVQDSTGEVIITVDANAVLGLDVLDGASFTLAIEAGTGNGQVDGTTRILPPTTAVIRACAKPDGCN